MLKKLIQKIREKYFKYKYSEARLARRHSYAKIWEGWAPFYICFECGNFAETDEELKVARKQYGYLVGKTELEDFLPHMVKKEILTKEEAESVVSLSSYHNLINKKGLVSCVARS